MNFDQMAATIASADGFIAALDQSGGSTPKALQGYGIEDSAWGTEEEMYALIHEMRSRIIKSPSFSNGKVIGAILFARTMNSLVDGVPTPQALRDRGIVPFLKVDKGLEDEADGVQLMKPIADLDAQCERAVELGVFGTKMRSVIHQADPSGIKSVVDQQFAFGRQILGHGLVPIIEPEVNIKSPERAAAEAILLSDLGAALDAMEGPERVMLKLSIPVLPNLYAPLIEHPRVLRVVALSGGFSTDEACARLADNKGMIASFSRGLLQDLRADLSDAEFDSVLGAAIDQIQAASTT